MPEDELLEDGQEEVFSRTEVLLGRIEHHSEAGGAAEAQRRPSRLQPDAVTTTPELPGEKRPRREGAATGPGVRA